MSAWLQALLMGFALGVVFGLCVALILVRVEANRVRRRRRPGYLTPQQPSWLKAQLEAGPHTHTLSMEDLPGHSMAWSDSGYAFPTSDDPADQGRVLPKEDT